MGGLINSVFGLSGFERLEIFLMCQDDHLPVRCVKSKRKGYKEDFDFEELEAAIELYKEHEEEDK